MGNASNTADQLLTTPEALARYAAKIAPQDNGCWDWTAAVGAGGYGMFKVARGLTMQAHRIAHWLYKGDPTGFLVLHSCDRPICYNPQHLRLGTHEENMADRRSRPSPSPATLAGAR